MTMISVDENQRNITLCATRDPEIKGCSRRISNYKETLKYTRVKILRELVTDWNAKKKEITTLGGTRPHSMILQSLPQMLHGAIPLLLHNHKMWLSSINVSFQVLLQALTSAFGFLQQLVQPQT